MVISVHGERVGGGGWRGLGSGHPPRVGPAGGTRFARIRALKMDLERPSGNGSVACRTPGRWTVRGDVAAEDFFSGSRLSGVIKWAQGKCCEARERGEEGRKTHGEQKGSLHYGR